MTQNLPDLPKTTQPVAAEPGFRCRQSGLVATRIYTFSRGLLCSDSEMGTVAGETATEMDHQPVASSPLSSLVKPHQTHRGGAQGRGDRQAEITMHPGGVLAWVPSKARPELKTLGAGSYLGDGSQNESGSRGHGKEKG